MPCPISTLPGWYRDTLCALECDPLRQNPVRVQASRKPGLLSAGARHAGTPARICAAAHSTARTIRLWAPQRQRLPFSALRTAASSGSGSARNNEAADQHAGKTIAALPCWPARPGTPLEADAARLDSRAPRPSPRSGLRRCRACACRNIPRARRPASCRRRIVRRRSRSASRTSRDDRVSPPAAACCPGYRPSIISVK